MAQSGEQLTAEWPANFHPAVRDWLVRSFRSPTEPQAEAWPHILAGRDVLVAAPTGSGKTLCAFLSAIDALVREAQTGPLPDETRVLYISPLKALSSDVERNLQIPLLGVRASLRNLDFADAPVTTALRTGDTPVSERARHTKRPAHIYVTTPESFFILLTSEGGRRMLSTVQTVIVDEVHAMIRDKRGAHLALSLERLDDLLQQSGRKRALRVGLSATQKPISRVAEFLVGVSIGSDGSTSTNPCVIVDRGHRRHVDLGLCVPSSPLESVMSAECWTEIYDQLVRLVESHRTVLIFTNTRRLAERVTRFLSERLSRGAVTSHHGSLSRKQRQNAELALKEGRLKALVATASLELGIDVGDVDLVCQLGSPGGIATLLQRIGRSGHFVGGTPKGRVFPLSRDDLVECAALLQAAELGELDELVPPEAPLDILAQQIVAWASTRETSEDELLSMVRRAAPYRALDRDQFFDVLSMLADGYATSRGRRSAYLHHDRLGKRIRARRGARLAAITNGGAIPDNFDYEVLLEPSDVRIGTVHEDFAIESMAGDVFQLGNSSYQILKVDPGAVRVRSAPGVPPTIPFWIGEAPSRTDELSFAVSRLRERVAETPQERLPALQQELSQLLGENESAAAQLISYLRATLTSLGHMPTQKTLVVERFFDDTEGMHIVMHSPFGSRFNRGLGLALRKRFCRSFNVELQAAAGEDALVLSLGPMHSFPLESVFHFLGHKTVRDVLIQALLDAPLFQTRWRWNASRALGVLRFRGGKKVPPRFQRMQSDDLLALCFPDQVACLENIAGDRQIPRHPLVHQTILDSLTEAMDVSRLESVLSDVAAGRVVCIARDVTEPSPLAHEILGARPYTFLDDAPLEERRTQAVQMRRFLDPETARDIGALSPDAIAQVVEEATPNPRDADELHDALLVHAALTEGEVVAYAAATTELLAAGRAFFTTKKPRLLMATERVSLARAVFDQCPNVAIVESQDAPLNPEDGRIQLVRGRLEMVGPTTATELAEALGLSIADTSTALLALEGEGFALRGRFRLKTSDEGRGEEEFCERRLLARIHRLTLAKLRREIEPVSPAVFYDFLTHHQGLQAESKREGVMGTLAVLTQLSGFSSAADAWESHILPARVRLYQPTHLDQLCLSGQVTYACRSNSTSAQLRRSTRLLIIPREDLDLHLRTIAPGSSAAAALSADARKVLDVVTKRGASFFDDVRRSTGLLPSRAETAVSELLGAGLLTTDSYSAVRGLTGKSRETRTPRPHSRRRNVRSPVSGLATAGRLSLIEESRGWPESVPQTSPALSAAEVGTAPDISDEDLQAIAWQLLERWGVLFRKLLEREPHAPAWGALLPVLRRLEARGEIRGGRFVTLFSGEQFATTEAIATLRKVRRGAPSTALLRISACDPLNLVGILTPDPRVNTKPTSLILIRGGVPLAIREGGVARLLPKQPGVDDASPLSLRDAEQAFRTRLSPGSERLSVE